VLLLILPRASEVSTEYAYEDAAMPPTLEPWQPAAPITGRELGLLEVSCLDHRRLSNPVRALHERRPAWRQIYPEQPEVRVVLQRGAEAFTRGEYTTAVERFGTAVRLEVMSDPSLPMKGPGRQDNGNLHLSEFRLLFWSGFGLPPVPVGEEDEEAKVELPKVSPPEPVKATASA
jgi:hypothetical protein